MSADHRFIQAKAREFETLSKDVHGAWAGDFWFVQMADAQLGLHDEVGCSLEKEVEMILIASKIINGISPRPAFVCVCGDMSNTMPNGHDGVAE